MTLMKFMQKTHKNKKKSEVIELNECKKRKVKNLSVKLRKQSDQSYQYRYLYSEVQIILFKPKERLMLQTDYDFVFKILLIGNSAVGKSSLLLRFADDVFHQTFLPTIGVDFKIRTIDHSGSIVKLQMWDTAGQEKFKTITSAYYKGSQGIILVFDLCDRKSFQDVQNWIAESEKYSNLQPVKILVGNKSDLVSERQVSKEEAQRFAENEGMTYYEASAKTKKNVETIFQTLADEMKQKFMRPSEKKPTKNPARPALPLRPVKEEKKKASCLEMFFNLF